MKRSFYETMAYRVRYDAKFKEQWNGVFDFPQTLMYKTLIVRKIALRYEILAYLKIPILS